MQHDQPLLVAADLGIDPVDRLQLLLDAARGSELTQAKSCRRNALAFEVSEADFAVGFRETMLGAEAKPPRAEPVANRSQSPGRLSWKPSLASWSRSQPNF